jgi:uncharacterized membrane protein SpoIIM required for sporulation
MVNGLSGMNAFLFSIWTALRRARAPILWIGLMYLAGLVAGAGMVHLHNGFALAYRDKLVGRAMASDPAALASERGFPVRAALWDFAGNLGRGALPSTVMGLAVVLPFPQAAFRGWVGGVVSVNDQHRSRLGSWRGGSYYLGVLLLQLLPYALAGGAGVRLGLGFLMPAGRWGYRSQQRWLTIPAEGVRDVARIYVLIVPLFLFASLVEFLIG